MIITATRDDPGPGLAWEVDLDAMALRYALLATHYRSPLPMSPALLASSRKALRRLYAAARPCTGTEVPDAVLAALCDDLPALRAAAEPDGPLALAELARLTAAARAWLPEETP